MEQGQDIFYCFSDVIFGRTGLQCSCLASFQAEKRLRITERGDLRLLLSEFDPDVEKLISLHQVHPSH